MSLWKSLLVLLLGFAMTAGIYYGVQHYVGGAYRLPARTTKRTPAWPAPPASTPPHPLQAALRWLGEPPPADPDAGVARRARLLGPLLGIATKEPASLPHPARMRADLRTATRARVRSVLTCLRFGRPCRSAGLTLRVACVEAPTAGATAQLFATVSSTDGRTRVTPAIAAAIAERLAVASAGAPFIVAEAPPGAAPPDEPRRGGVPVSSRALRYGVFDAAGRATVVVYADLTGHPAIPPRWGPGPHVLISNRLVATVRDTPAHAPR